MDMAPASESLLFGVHARSCEESWSRWLRPYFHHFSSFSVVFHPFSESRPMTFTPRHVRIIILTISTSGNATGVRVRLRGPPGFTCPWRRGEAKNTPRSRSQAAERLSGGTGSSALSVLRGLSFKRPQPP